ncbi:MAG TPA: ribulose-phosphate 3-epimerase [Candidatus Merdicola faecigallinarum]|uniref:Ribulose-phosphate 3-epimerase n=1 Tax=Candidatus Merdicola faecigallinarum TaxID=2840862 RepID=A0A9D1M1V9_9FIRM|nr:ribulose-phosphate 3-epimerase [Candidatus Merdicola faecigallinarum]
MVEISTSILNIKSENRIKTMYDLEVAKTDYFHIDIMDGKFVENDTKEKMITYMNELKQISNTPLDIHLMVENVKENIEECLAYNPNILTFHIEAVKEEERKPLIEKIKKQNCRVGIAIKPETDIEEIKEYLPYIHMVLIMTVEPGKGGQKLIPETIEKIKELKEYLDKQNLEIDIEVDGGINLENVDILKTAGANIIVAGTAILNAEDYKEVITEMKQ